MGQVVAALTFYGSYSQSICLAARDLLPVPPGIDPAAVGLVLNDVAAHQMLRRKVGYQDLGPHYFEERGRERIAKPLVARREGLGHDVTVEPRPAAA